MVSTVRKKVDVEHNFTRKAEKKYRQHGLIASFNNSLRKYTLGIHKFMAEAILSNYLLGQW